MPEMPQAAPLPDRPPLHLTGGYLVIASPDTIAEASFSVPAVRALRGARPQSTITVVANELTAALWRRVTEINHVIEHSAGDSARKIVKLLQGADLPFDSSIAWADSPSAQAFAKSKIPQRLGYPTDRLKKHLTDPVEVVREIGPIEHQVKHYLLFVEKLGARPFEPSNFTPPPRPEADSAFRLALVPGSDFGPAAEWPLERFIDLAKDVSEHCEIVILPSPGRPGPAEQLAKAVNQTVPETSADSLLDLLARCHGVVANDGSLPHLSAFLGTPSLVFFGPNEPEWRRPLGKMHRVIRRHVPCSGCLLNKCPLDHRCLSEITVADALAELRSLFAEG